MLTMFQAQKLNDEERNEGGPGAAGSQPKP